jgi:hypothetical protein
MEVPLYLSNEMHCCGLTEIVDLLEHDSPKEAMLGFMNQVVIKNRYTKLTRINIGGFYIFSGVEKVLNPNIVTYENGIAEPDYDYIDDDRCPVKIKYASEFAKFIVRNKLGVLRASPLRPNTLNHPDHIVKCWIWAPDIKALKIWYNANYR